MRPDRSELKLTAPTSPPEQSSRNSLRRTTSGIRLPTIPKSQCRGAELRDPRQEMLAVMRALEDWRHFLEGAHHKVEIWTDHKNLEYFMMAKKLNRRQARCPLPIQIRLLHASPTGTFYGQVDALSRRADHGTGAGDNNNVTLLCPEFFAAHTIRASPDCHWKEKSATSFGIFTRETARASRRTQSRSPQRNSEGLRESHSERRSGRSMMASLFPD